MNTAFKELMKIRNRPDASEASITGSDPVFSTRFRIAETGAGILGAIGVAVSDIWEIRTGRRQKVSVDTRHAGGALNSFAYLQQLQTGGSYKTMGNSPAAEANYAITQPFLTKDNRWFLPHFGIAHLKERVLGVLQCEGTPASVRRAVSRWEAQDLEDAIAAVNACGGMIRTNDEWLAHPHGQALAAQPVVEVEKINDSEPEHFWNEGDNNDQALTGLRVLDLTRILAGPVAARTCAEHGADVLMVGSRGLPQIKNFVIDLSHGKRSCNLNLNVSEEAIHLRELVKGADVFSQGYRPGVMERRGLGPEELCTLRPGLIYTSINCYGQQGPFRNRAGWEQVAQSITGICKDHGGVQPALLPVPACDYMTGYLGAYGTLLALARRAKEGGSYHVKVSLCQSGMFLYRQGRVEFNDPEMDLSPAEVRNLQMDSNTVYGSIRHLAPVIHFSETKPRWSLPSPALGQHAADWLNS